MKDLIILISFVASAINLIIVEHPGDFHKCIAFIFFVVMACLWIGRIQRANALRRKVIKSFRKNTQKEYKNLIFLLVED